MMKRDDKVRQFNKIIKAIRRNAEKGLHQFYDAYAKIIVITARAICGSSYKVDEVVNNVLIKIWKLADRVEKIDNPEGWIYTITANAAKDALRERCILPLNEDIVSGEDEEREIIDKYAFNWMIQDLSQIEQTVMIHKFVLMYTFQEISDDTEKPLTTITSIYYRALEKIKNKINKKN